MNLICKKQNSKEGAVSYILTLILVITFVIAAVKVPLKSSDAGDVFHQCLLTEHNHVNNFTCFFAE